MWFGTQGGVSKYDGKEFINLAEKDGLANNTVQSIHRDSNGAMWFGTGGGISRYDGKEFANFTTEDGLTGNIVHAVYSAPDGALWIGTHETGVSRYDGEKFVNFSTEDGLAHKDVVFIYGARDGMIWFGTADGVSRYDGKALVDFSAKEIYARCDVRTVHYDDDGILWFGTFGGGVYMYDGVASTSLDTRDGLVGDLVYSIHQDADGFYWFGASEGITRYRRSVTPPKANIVSITTEMIYFWDGLGQDQKSAMSLLGEVLEDSNGYASAQMLLSFVREQNLVGALNLTALPELERVLDDLFVSEVLERERAGGGQYEYRFRADLFRLWVRQAHSVWQQA